MKIWIDMATSPQVLFFRPIIAELQKRGHELLMTTRHCAETVPLADSYGFTHTVMGAHGGKTLMGKGAAIALRTVRLTRFARPHAISLAVSHGSFSQALAAGWLSIPSVVFADYEGHPAEGITCCTASKILVPNVFCKANLFHHGASEDKIETYGGLKENVYLAGFVPDPMFLETTGIPAQKIVVTMRPPNLAATYHRFENPLFDELLNYVLSHPNTFVVLLPRGSEQRRKYEGMGLTNLLIPDEVLDGPNLIYHSDLVIGAGGTMNREATVLGTPVYSVFKGRLGSVDRYLISSGKMARIEDSTDVSKIKIRKKPKTTSAPWRAGQELLDEVIEKTLEVPRSILGETR